MDTEYTVCLTLSWHFKTIDCFVAWCSRSIFIVAYIAIVIPNRLVRNSQWWWSRRGSQEMRWRWISSSRGRKGSSLVYLELLPLDVLRLSLHFLPVASCAQSTLQVLTFCLSCFFFISDSSPWFCAACWRPEEQRRRGDCLRFDQWRVRHGCLGEGAWSRWQGMDHVFIPGANCYNLV